jgi:hypothetical protein
MAAHHRIIFLLTHVLQGAPAPPEMALSPRLALPPAANFAPVKVAKTDAGIAALDLQAPIGVFKKQSSMQTNIEPRVSSGAPAAGILDASVAT